MFQKYRNLEERLIVNSYVDPESGCWVWLGKIDVTNGYGRINLRVGGKQVTPPVHRVAYEALVGPIPAGMHIDHVCCVRRCINPNHLDLVTPGENNVRRSERNRTQ